MKRRVLGGSGKTGGSSQAETRTIPLRTSASAGDREVRGGREKGKEVEEEGEGALGLGPAHGFPKD